jgi:hypothetical protein
MSCNERVTDNPHQDRPPTTHLWLFPDSTVGIGVSRQHLRWWGEDPDGVVVGFLFGFTSVTGNVTRLPQPDTLRYTWVTGNDTTLLFPLDTLFKKFIVVVRGVDNQFAGLPTQSIVRMLPFPYWDQNDNGVFDGADMRLTTLMQATDPDGAVLTFPIRNSPPSVSWVINPLDQTVLFKGPDTTYTVATFSWTGSDPDGNNTLRSYRIALNDTSTPSNWVTLPSLRDTLITVVVPRLRSDAAGTGSVVPADLYSGSFLGAQARGQIPGLRLDALNTLYVEVKDVAGEYSPAITMPAAGGRWFVKRPSGRVLLVSDYVNTDAGTAAATYLSTLTAVPDPHFASIDRLDIGEGLTLVDKSAGVTGDLVPPFIDPALIYTFLLYDYVVWYTDQFPSLYFAQLSLFPSMQNGLRVIFSTSFLNTIDPRGALRDFAPIDSVSSVNLTGTIAIPSVGDNRIPANTIVFADSSVPGDIYPQLAFNPAPVNNLIFMRPIYRRSDARYIYHLQPDSMTVYHFPDSTVARAARARYVGSPNLGVIDGQGRIVFIGLPLHLLNNTTYGSGLTAFFQKAISHFSTAQRVSRRRF